MQVNSYAEIFTTMIGWHMNNVIWDVLAGTGIALLPFVGILVEHWRAAFIDGEESGGAAAALRAIEMDVYVGITVMMLTCVPTAFLSINRGEVFYRPPATTATPSPAVATGDAPQSTYGSTLATTPGSVNVPLMWYAVSAVSSGVANAIIAGAGMSLDDFRKVTEASKHAAINDPQVRFELQRFYNECYIPTRSKYFRAPTSEMAREAIDAFGPDDPEWMGSHAFRYDPALYGSMYAEEEVPGWPFDPVRDWDQAGSSIMPEWGRPTCKEWWEGGAATGLQAKLLAAAGETSKLNELVSAFGQKLSQDRREDIVAQTLLDKTRLTTAPDRYVPQNSNAFKETVTGTTAMIAGFMTTFFTWLATAVLKPALPFIQALLLMGIYMLMPIVMVVSRYSVAAMVQATFAIFSIKMWSVLWFVTDFLDDRLVRAVYPDADSALTALTSFFSIGDPTKAMLLSLVIMSMYVALPALWSGMMSMVGWRVGSALSPAANASSENIVKAGTSAEGLASKGTRVLARGARSASRSIRERLK